MATASIASTTDHVPAQWVSEQITALRELADKSGDHGVAAGLDTAALVLETGLRAYRDGGAA